MFGNHKMRMKIFRQWWEERIANEEKCGCKFICSDCKYKVPVLMEWPSRNQVLEFLKDIKEERLICQSCKKEIKEIEKYGTCEECDLSILEQL